MHDEDLQAALGGMSSMQGDAAAAARANPNDDDDEE
jgi:hypothetical protein